MRSFKSSGLMMGEGDRFGGTTKASNHGGLITSANSNFLLKESALTPGSLFRGTFLNNFESTGFVKRVRQSRCRRSSTGKIPPKTMTSLIKMKTDLTNSPPLRKIEIPINPEGQRMNNLKRDGSSFLSKFGIAGNGLDSDFLPFSFDFQDVPSPA